MKRLYFIIVIGIFLANCSKDHKKYIQELPDSRLINEVIAATIKLDSLNRNYNISKSIRKIRLYFPVRWDKDSIPLPPPPPPPSLSLLEMFSYTDYLNDPLKRKNDSIFFSLQDDTSRKFEIDEQITSKFNNKSQVYYHFYVPVFTFDKRCVFVQFWRDCGPLCGVCESIVLKKEQNKWLRIDKWSCGEK